MITGISTIWALSALTLLGIFVLVFISVAFFALWFIAWVVYRMFRPIIVAINKV